MPAVRKIDSNSVGLRYAEEQSPQVLPGTPIWVPLEPNSFDDFGGELSLVAREPINDSRQRKKGVAVDLDVTAGFETDITQTNLQDLFQGLFFADLRRKTELAVTGTVNGTKTYTVASGGAGFFAGDLLFAKQFATVAAANGLKTVASSTGTTVVVNESIGAANDTTGVISRVGFAFASGDAQIVASGSLWGLQTTTKNLTQLGLTVGDWVYVGGDLAAEQFATIAPFFARVRSIATNLIVFDKTTVTIAGADAGAAKTIKIFTGRLLKNEAGSLIKRRTYQLERTLGAPDDSFPAQIQSEYVTGAILDEVEINAGTADKVTASLSFLGAGSEIRTGVTGVKSGTRPALVESDAFNTSSNVKRIYLSQVSQLSTLPTPLFAYVTDLSITIANNGDPNKAVGVFGAFDITAGTFEVDVSLTAYFADVAAINAVRNNLDLTLDMHFVRANAGISIDFPLLAPGNGKVDVTKDEAITIPLDLTAATAAKIDPNLNHTCLMVFWDYLPTIAG